MNAERTKLSSREQGILDLLLQKKRNRDIAEELGLSPRTVEAHRANILRLIKEGHLPHINRDMLRPPLGKAYAAKLARQKRIATDDASE
jgi:FixJ family two-component response regulator